MSQIESLQAVFAILVEKMHNGLESRVDYSWFQYRDPPDQIHELAVKSIYAHAMAKLTKSKPQSARYFVTFHATIFPSQRRFVAIPPDFRLAQVLMSTSRLP